MPARWRRTPLPPDWPTIRRAVLERDGRCMWPDDGTPHAGPLEVDHIRPGDNHDLGNLQALCRRHHATKTGRENAARLHASKPKRTREPPRHPGLLW